MELDEVAPFKLGLILPQSTFGPAWTGPVQIQIVAVSITSAETALNIDPLAKVLCIFIDILNLNLFQ